MEWVWSEQRNQSQSNQDKRPQKCFENSRKNDNFDIKPQNDYDSAKVQS